MIEYLKIYMYIFLRLQVEKERTVTTSHAEDLVSKNALESDLPTGVLFSLILFGFKRSFQHIVELKL